MTTTVDTFLARMKRRITVPASQALLQNDQMLGMADDVTRERLVPLIMSLNQNFFTVPYTQELVAGQEAYSIPYRAIGRGLRDLKLKIGTGQSANVNNLALIALEDAPTYFGQANAVPIGFYFRGDKVVMVPPPVDEAYELMGWYNLQPSAYVETTDACLVDSVSTNVVTCTNVPSTFMAGTVIDFVQGYSGCSVLEMDVTITNVSGTQITFNSADDIPTDLVQGDFIALKQTTPVIQLPDECVPLLELWTAERILYAIGDFEGANLLAQRSVDVQKNMENVLSPRVIGEQTKIVNRNGLLRGKGFNTWAQRRGGYYP